MADSTIGMMVGATDRGLCFVQFADSDSELLELLRREYPLADIAPMGATYPDHFREWMASLENHLKGYQPHLNLPTDVRATAFQMKVWRYLQSIHTLPCGPIRKLQLASVSPQPPPPSIIWGANRSFGLL